VQSLREVIESSPALVAAVSNAATTAFTSGSAPSSSSSTSSSSAKRATSTSTSSSSGVGGVGVSGGSDLASLQTTVVQSLTMAQEVQKKGNLRKARDIYDQLVSIIFTHIHIIDVTVPFEMMSMNERMVGFGIVGFGIKCDRQVR
jgi:hypothetical protein